MACAGCVRRRQAILKLYEEALNMARGRSMQQEKELLQLKKERLDARIRKQDAAEKEKELAARIKRMGSR